MSCDAIRVEGPAPSAEVAMNFRRVEKSLEPIYLRRQRREKPGALSGERAAHHFERIARQVRR